MIWWYFVVVGLVVGLIMKRKREGIIINLVTGVVGAVIGGTAFEYGLRAVFSSYVDMAKWGLYMSLSAAFFVAVVIMVIKRRIADSGR